MSQILFTVGESQVYFVGASTCHPFGFMVKILTDFILGYGLSKRVAGEPRGR